MENKIYDVIIIGSGPAGLSAGIYAARAKMDTLIIEKGISGGQIAGTADVENYPGAPLETTGPSLVARMADQAKYFGAESIMQEVVEVDLKQNPKVIKTSKEDFKAKAVIIATGANPRKIGAQGEDKFAGRGVSFCATCDGPFAEGMHAYVVGGGDSAVEEALFVAKFARKVTIIHRRDELRAAKSIQEKAFNNEKIDFMWNSQVTEVKGENFIESFVVEDTLTGEKKEVFPSDGDSRIFLFVFIGHTPNTELFEGQIEMEKSYIVTDENKKTNIDGVYAAGDVRVTPLRQVVTATGDGAIAATQAEKYIDSLE